MRYFNDDLMYVGYFNDDMVFAGNIYNGVYFFMVTITGLKNKNPTQF